jgi:hypothetical protein
MHIDETVNLPSGRVLRLHRDGTYLAQPPYGFHTGAEQSVGVELSGGKANVTLRTDATYDLEYAT